MNYLRVLAAMDRPELVVTVVIDVIRWMTATDEGSWVGHGLQGLGFTLIFALLGRLMGIEIGGQEVMHFAGFIYTIGAFSHREADNAIGYLLAQRLTRARQLDGIMDFMAPYAASLLVVVAFEVF